jgi:sporulation protein YlmC with PRC-barrel domain
MRALIASVVATTILTGSAFALEAPSFVKVTPSDQMATNLLSLDVYNGSGDDVGTIKDFVLGSGQMVSGYVLSVGGFLGVGTKYVIVAPDSVKVAYDTKDSKWHATMNATKDQLTNAPEFKYKGKADASKS